MSYLFESDLPPDISHYELVAPAVPYWPQCPGHTDVVIPLPAGLTMPEDPYTLRQTQTVRAMADGAQVDGGQVDPREITLEGRLHFGSFAEARSALLSLRGSLWQPDLALIVDDYMFVNLRTLKDFNSKPQKGSNRCNWDIQIAWTAANPYWYILGRQTVDYTFTGSGTFSINNSGSPGPSPLIITVTAASGVPVPPWTLTNLTDGGLSCQMADLGLVGPEIQTVDGFQGTAVGSIRGNLIQFQLGSFLRLLPGVNTFSWAGGAATVTLSWWLRSP